MIREQLDRMSALFRILSSPNLYRVMIRSLCHSMVQVLTLVKSYVLEQASQTQVDVKAAFVSEKVRQSAVHVKTTQLIKCDNYSKEA